MLEAPRGSARLRRLAGLAEAELLAELHTHREGLTQREAAARWRRSRRGAVEHETRWPLWSLLWKTTANPFNALLALMAALALSVNDKAAASVIGVMVLLSTLLRLVQEGRARHAVERLRSLVRNTASVKRRRSGQPSSVNVDTLAAELWVEIAVDRLVPGDIVRLSAGDLVPADCRILDSRAFFVTQSALTGESLPVAKGTLWGDATDEESVFQPSLIFLGSSVVSGYATAVVIHTGGKTIFGGIEKAISVAGSDAGSLQAGMNRIGMLLVRLAAVMLPLVFVLTGWTQGDWSAALLFALSVAVGLTPEMLPVVVTAALAKGAVDLSRSRVVVKSLDAIQALGAMNVLCMDKTGTLTEDRIVLDRHLDLEGNDSSEVLRLAWLNSHYQSGLRSALDHAVVAHPDAKSLLSQEGHWRVVDEIPFDFERRRLSVVIADAQRTLLVCKGAVDEVIDCCSGIRTPTGDRELDEAARNAARTLADQLGAQGLRTVAIAFGEVDGARTRFGNEDESALTLAGFVAFLDPPRESAAPALTALANHGVRSYVLTGDTPAIAASVCSRVGLDIKAILSGSELEALDDSALLRALSSTRVIARLTPAQKERIVRVLRGSGAVVGFLGDGINDGPALRAADVGISVNSAVDVAREAADIVLLEKSLLVVDAGVVLGRVAFCNMRRYLRMAAASNFGNVLSVVVASAFLPFLPMQPLQLLVQNLLYDLAQSAMPFDRVEASLVKEPLRWEASEISRFMFWFGPLSSVFDLLAFAVLALVLGLNEPARQSQFQAAWLLLGLATQVLAVQVLRSPGASWRGDHAAWPVTCASFAALALGAWIALGPLASVFGLEPPPSEWFAWLIALLAGYLAAIFLVGIWLARTRRT